MDFVAKYQFTELNFYTGGPLATRVVPGKEVEFNNLLTKIWNLGNVTGINIAIGSVNEMDRVVNFINLYQPKITGFVTEMEWWNSSPRDYVNAAALLTYMRTKSLGKLIGAYMGWPTQEEMTHLITLVDRIFMHAYVPDGKKTYSKLKPRLDMIMKAKPTKKVNVYPLFSAEWLPPEICNKGSKEPGFYDNMCFMGPWLKANGGPAGAESAFNKAERAGRTTSDNWRNYVNIPGFFYYSYTYLRNALK